MALPFPSLEPLWGQTPDLSLDGGPWPYFYLWPLNGQQFSDGPSSYPVSFLCEYHKPPKTVYSSLKAWQSKIKAAADNALVDVCMSVSMCAMYACKCGGQKFRLDVFLNFSPPVLDTGSLTESGVH